MNLENLLILSGVIFSIGLFGALSKKNVITVLMSIELMFNAVNIALVAFARYVVPQGIAVDPVGAEAEVAAALAEGTALGETVLNTLLTGQIFAIFIITVAAAEVALGLGIVIAMYRNRETVDVTQVNLMRG
ncbi:MAG: NADH-quinone oxidoreductase subunit NuoK [Chloroflexota bacterium]